MPVGYMYVNLFKGFFPTTYIIHTVFMEILLPVTYWKYVEHSLRI